MARPELAPAGFSRQHSGRSPWNLDKLPRAPSKSAALKRFLKSGIGAVLIWVVGSLVMAAIIAPWMYQGGKWLAATAELRELPGFIESLAASCRRARIDRYYDRSLLLSALVLLPPLLRRIHRLRDAGEPMPEPRAGFSWPKGWLQIGIGFAIAGGLLWTLAMILDAAGAYTLKEQPPGAGRVLIKGVMPAIAAPLLEEWLFRGILLGLWLRFARPATAVIGSSLVFAFLHFLKPPDGYEVATPDHPLAGFELLGKILLHFGDPYFFVTDFAVLFVVGLILAWARLRTGALWFPVGLHAGWVFAFKCYNLFYEMTPDHPLRPWGIGESLRSGLLPLLTLALTALVCRHAMRPFSRASR